MNVKRIKNVTKDFVLNLIASFIVTGILQLVIYPQLAGVLSSEKYGVLLTVIGIANTLAATVGSSLNNTRLLLNEKYKEEKQNGDFLPLLYVFNLLSAIILFVIVQKYENDNITNFILVLYMVACSIRTYGVVVYRTIINYVKNLICNIIVGVGYLIGLLVFLCGTERSNLWPVCFLLGEICAILYIHFSSEVFKEKLQFTPIFSTTLKKDVVLMATTLTANLLAYLDRLMLLPILGGEAVTTYTVASVFGKSLGVLMTPLAGVLLTYFSQKDFKMNRHSYWVFIAMNCGMASLFMAFSHFLGPWFTGIFYPAQIDASRAYIDISNTAAILIVLGNMTQPTVLRYAPSIWVLLIQIIYCVIYFVGGIVVVKQYGLMGFSYVALVSAFVKVLLQILVGDTYIKNQSVKIVKNAGM